jgi:hypothetical protein
MAVFVVVVTLYGAWVGRHLIFQECDEKGFFYASGGVRYVCHKEELRPELGKSPWVEGLPFVDGEPGE